MTHDDERQLGGTTAHHAATEDTEVFAEDDPMIADLGVALRAALAPHGDLRHTARHKVDRALQSRSALSGITSMGGCAIDTLRHLLTNPTRGADRYSMNRSRQRNGVQDRDPAGLHRESFRD